MLWNRASFAFSVHSLSCQGLPSPSMLRTRPYTGPLHLVGEVEEVPIQGAVVVLVGLEPEPSLFPVQLQ